MIPEGVAAVGVVLIAAMVVYAFAADARNRQELVDWAVSRGGHAAGSGANVPSEAGDVHVRRITHDSVTELNFSVLLAKHLEPMKIDARKFRPECSPAFRRTATDPELCAMLTQLKSRRIEIRRPNRKERKEGAVGSYVYLALFGTVTPEQRDTAADLIGRLAALM